MEINGYIQKPIAFDDQSLEQYSRFLSTNYGKPEQFTFDYIKWQYVDNPVGRAVGFDAFYRGELIAHVATIPLRAVIFGSTPTSDTIIPEKEWPTSTVGPG